MLNYTKSLYNSLSGTYYYETAKYTVDNIFDFLQAEDVEEIISLYLQIKKDYLIYTSTNKLSTQKYEFVGVARDGSHNCYAQVKSGNLSLDGDHFRSLTQNGGSVKKLLPKS